MSSITLNLGDAFLLDTPPNGMHLYIAIAEISGSRYLFVNVTTRRASSETACILQPNLDLPSFITRESVVAYQYAREIDVEALDRLIANNNCIAKGCCSPSALLEIQQGGIASKRLKKKYKIIVEAALRLT